MSTGRGWLLSMTARRLISIGSVLLLGLSTMALPAGAETALEGPEERRQPTTVRVGAASRSVLPLVEGSRAYLANLPPESDPYDLGVYVPEWDDGVIAVGNGAEQSAWVRDDIRAHAMAIEDLTTGRITALLSLDLYMMFRTDSFAMKAKVAELLGPELGARTTVLFGATHNHHGPETAFGVNHEWYDEMTDQAARTIVTAVRRREAAELRVAAGEHWFGASDGRDPRIYDPSLNVLQARALDDRAVLATVVQWNNHPESTLGWEPPAPPELPAICAEQGWEGEDCSAEGRYFTADFPGPLRSTIRERVGGEVVYFNGAIGLLVGPGGAAVWEVDRDHPLGNQFTPPPGAVGPGGTPEVTDENFRRAVIIGEQLGLAVLRLLRTEAERLVDPETSYVTHTYITRLSNIGFRYLIPQGELGNSDPVLYTCPPTGPKTPETCTSDGGATVVDPIIGDDIRVGDHLETEVGYLRIGPVGIMFMPGEVGGELTIGLPAGFDDNPLAWYLDAEDHAVGSAYEIPGYIYNRMDDRYKWTIGLGNDELGYHVPLADWRSLCVADFAGLPTSCQELFELGVMSYPDSMSGSECKAVTEDPSLLSQYGEHAFVVDLTCKYGQALGEANNHYEETNSAGWDLAADMMTAVAVVTGDDDPARINPDFPGYWQELLPPG